MGSEFREKIGNCNGLACIAFITKSEKYRANFVAVHAANQVRDWLSLSG